MNLFNSKRYTSLEEDSLLGKRFKQLGGVLFRSYLFKTLNSVRKNKAIDLSIPETKAKWVEMLDFATSDITMKKRVKLAFSLVSVLVLAYSFWFFILFLDYNLIVKLFLLFSVSSLCLFLIAGEIQYYTPLTEESFNKLKDLFPELFTHEPKSESKE